jgi:hypothetical protein
MPISVGVIDEFAAPPLADLKQSISSPSPLANPYSGAGSLNSSNLGAQAYGITWDAVSAPARAGRSTRSIDVFEEPWLSLVFFYQLADNSLAAANHVLTHDATGFVTFVTGAPVSVGYHVLPGWAAHFTWLVS